MGTSFCLSHVAQVMLGGRLYDAATLNEQVTGDRVRPAYWWQAKGNPRAGEGRGSSAHAH